VNSIIVIAGEDPSADASGPLLSRLNEFYTSLRVDLHTVYVGFGDVMNTPVWAGFWQDTLSLHYGVIFAVPSSPLQHVYLDVVSQTMAVQPAGIPSWVMHASGAAETSRRLDALLTSRQARVFPRLHWQPTQDIEATHLELLQFLNFCFTHSQRRR